MVGNALAPLLAFIGTFLGWRRSTLDPVAILFTEAAAKVGVGNIRNADLIKRCGFCPKHG